MRTDKKLWRNRKARKELARRLQSENPGLEVIHPHAAGIDVGNSAHYVAVRPDRDAQPVRRFECFTADLHRLADWLETCGVKTVALQSTGVYWIPLYDILEERGFEVYLVNARHTKNLPGRKSDVQESQWLLKLHTYGLLNNSFQPPSKIRVLRTYWRQRAEHVSGARTAAGGLDLTAKPDLPWRAVPTLAQQARRAKSHHRHGSSPCPPGLSNAEVWPTVRRQRCGILRAKKSPTANRVPEKEGRPTRPTGHTSPCLKLPMKKFLESRITGDVGAGTGLSGLSVNRDLARINI